MVYIKLNELQLQFEMFIMYIRIILNWFAICNVKSTENWIDATGCSKEVSFYMLLIGVALLFALCTRISWPRRPADCENTWSQYLHLNRFSPCNCLCWRNSLRLENVFPQSSHLNGRSSVCCDRMWSCRWPGKMNARSHCWHWCGLILLWLFICRPKWLEVTNDTPHRVHWYGFSFWWIRMWMVM